MKRSKVLLIIESIINHIDLNADVSEEAKEVLDRLEELGMKPPSNDSHSYVYPRNAYEWENE